MTSPAKPWLMYCNSGIRVWTAVSPEDEAANTWWQWARKMKQQTPDDSEPGRWSSKHLTTVSPEDEAANTMKWRKSYETKWAQMTLNPRDKPVTSVLGRWHWTLVTSQSQVSWADDVEPTWQASHKCLGQMTLNPGDKPVTSLGQMTLNPDDKPMTSVQGWRRWTHVTNQP